MFTLTREEFLRRCELHPRNDGGTFGRMTEGIILSPRQAEKATTALRETLVPKWCKVSANRFNTVVEAIFKVPQQKLEAEQATLREAHLAAVRQTASAAMDRILGLLMGALDKKQFLRAHQLLEKLSSARHVWAIEAREGGKEGRLQKLREIGKIISSQEQPVVEREALAREERREQELFALRAHAAVRGPQSPNGHGGHSRSQAPMRQGKTARDRQRRKQSLAPVLDGGQDTVKIQKSGKRNKK